MLHIVLTVLKLIGIVLAILLGIIIFAILVILLVPIRYKISSEYKEKFNVDAKIHWILHILHARIRVINNEISYKVRIFGFAVIDSAKEKKVKVKKGKGNKKVKEPKPVEILREKTVELVEEAKEEITQDILPDKEVVEDLKKTKEYKKKIGIIKNIKNKVSNLIRKIKDIFLRILDVTKNIKEKYGKIREFLKNEVNKIAIKNCWTGIKKILKHIAPTKYQGYIKAGTGDPYSMGQVVATASIFYPLYGTHVRFVPDFENKMLEGTFDGKGRIRIGTLLIIVIKLLLDKNNKQFYKNINNLKEEF